MFWKEVNNAKGGKVESCRRIKHGKGGLAQGEDEVQRIWKEYFEDRVDWIWRLCNIAFESDVVPKDWRPAVIVTLYKGKGERIECKNYRHISFLSVVEKIYVGILVDRVHRVTVGLIDDEQRGFREGRECVDQTFTLKQMGKKAGEKK